MSEGVRRDLGEEGPLVAISLMVIAMSVVPAMDAFAKLLSRDLPVEEVAWWRYVSGLCFILPLALWRYGVKTTLWPLQPRLQILRGVLTAASSLLFFAAIAEAPLADSLALIFLAPLVVTAASPFVLGEKVGLHRWSAVVVGFFGALIVIRPGLGNLDLPMLLAAAAGLCHGAFLLVTRQLSRSGHTLATLWVTTTDGCLALLPLQSSVWVMRDPQQWHLLAAMRFVPDPAHLLLVKPFEIGTAALLAPS